MGILVIVFCCLYYKCTSVICRWCIKCPLQILVSSLNLFIVPVTGMFCRCFVKRSGRERCKKCAALKCEKDDLRKELNEEKISSKTYIENVERLQRALDRKHDIEHRYEVLKKRSDKITLEMASVLEERGELENVNDEFSNTKLAKRFENLYSNSWTSLSEWIDDNKPDLNELSRISILTNLMKCGYKRCLRMADDELRVFLYLDEGDCLPTKEKDPELYKLRKKYGQTKNKREGITKIILDEVSKNEEFSSLLPDDETLQAEGRDLIQTFFVNYLECCWLMTISQPQLVLDFDVTGYKYAEYIKDRFTLFSSQDVVVDKAKPKDTIVHVVWPSVELLDGSGIHTKGDVITVNVGQEADTGYSPDSCGDDSMDTSLSGVRDTDTCKGNKLSGDYIATGGEVNDDGTCIDGQRETTVLEKTKF